MKKFKIIFAILRVFIKDPALVFSLLRNMFTLFFYRIKSAATRKRFIIISLTEHLGDIVAAEPISGYLRDHYTNSKIIWVVDKQYAAIVQSNPKIDITVQVSCFTEWILLKKTCRKKTVFDLHIDKKLCSKHHFVYRSTNPYDINIDNYLTKGNLLYCFSRSANLETDDTASPTLYLDNTGDSIENKKYIVFHSSANFQSKSLNDESCNRIAGYILDSAKDLYIVEIGFHKRILLQSDRIIDYTGNRHLAEIAGLIKFCQLYIGIDSGFAHFANALRKNSLIFIGHLGGFQNYMPYSGFLQQHREKMIYYYPGPLEEMKAEIVAEKLKSRLNQLEEYK